MSSLAVCRPSAATPRASPRHASSPRAFSWQELSGLACTGRNSSKSNALTSRAPSSHSAEYRVADVSRCRSNRVITRAAASSSSSSTSVSAADVSAPITLTYLEGNSWLWSVDGVKVLVDPIIEGPLDFGIPWLYTGYKKVLKSLSLDDVIDADVVLITQSLDDHMHVRTLKALAARRPDVPVIATPNGKAFLDSLFSNVTYIEPGSSTSFTSSKGARLSVKAVPGPVLGPPWQRPENGYIVRGEASGASIYIEPHCVFNEAALKEGGERVDVLVTPVVKQELPGYTLVSGQEDAVRLAKVVGARYVAPMANADVDASGILSALVTPNGTLSSFKEILRSEDGINVEVLQIVPGQAVAVTV
ncbi:unnamed protein product [Closterium sp. NIES-54]